MTPRKEAAFSRNTGPDPSAATRSPPKAGPTARATLNATAPSVTAAGRSSLATSSGVIASHAGALTAAPKPRAKARISRSQGVVIPAIVKSPNVAATINIHAWVINNSRRRSMRSAKVPDGTASRTTGKLPAVSTSATMSVDVEREVISHASPTSSIHVPTFEATAAIHSARKSGSRRGPHVDAKLCRWLRTFAERLCCGFMGSPLVNYLDPADKGARSRARTSRAQMYRGC